MDCTGVASHLVAYHLATVSDEERDAIDAHLLGCRGCLETFLALKRAMDRGPATKPSAAVRARLRAEVAASFPRRTLARRIPLYQGLALAAAAAVVALLVPSLIKRNAPYDAREATHEVDTARPRAVSLQIY
jgi:hypothetical protein